MMMTTTSALCTKSRSPGNSFRRWRRRTVSASRPTSPASPTPPAPTTSATMCSTPPPPWDTHLLCPRARIPRCLNRAAARPSAPWRTTNLRTCPCATPPWRRKCPSLAAARRSTTATTNRPSCPSDHRNYPGAAKSLNGPSLTCRVSGTGTSWILLTALLIGKKNYVRYV